MKAGFSLCGKLHREIPVLALYWPCTGKKCMHSNQQTLRAYCPTNYTVSDGVTSFSKKSSNAGRLYEIYAIGSRLFLYVRSAFWLTKHQAGQAVRRPFSIQQEIKTCLDVESWKWKLRLLDLDMRSSILRAKLSTPSTLNIDFIQWHTQLIMCAVR